MSISGVPFNSPTTASSGKRSSRAAAPSSLLKFSILKIALCLLMSIAPSSLNSPGGDPTAGGKRMYTAAAVLGGKLVLGSKKTTRCDIGGCEGKVYAC